MRSMTKAIPFLVAVVIAPTAMADACGTFRMTIGEYRAAVPPHAVFETGRAAFHAMLASIVAAGFVAELRGGWVDPGMQPVWEAAIDATTRTRASYNAAIPIREAGLAGDVPTHLALEVLGAALEADRAAHLVMFELAYFMACLK